MVSSLPGDAADQHFRILRQATAAGDLEQSFEVRKLALLSCVKLRSQLRHSVPVHQEATRGCGRRPSRPGQNDDVAGTAAIREKRDGATSICLPTTRKALLTGCGPIPRHCRVIESAPELVQP